MNSFSGVLVALDLPLLSSVGRPIGASFLCLRGPKLVIAVPCSVSRTCLPNASAIFRR